MHLARKAINSLTASNPDILVILPTLGDRLDTLQETLESIKLQQAEVELTLVLVAPSSAINARKMATKYGAVIVDDPKTGISEAINCGIRARTSESFYAWIGDDDLFRPGGLKTLKSLLSENTESVVSYGGCEYIDPNGKILVRSRAGKFAQFLLPWGPDLIPHPGAMIRLDALQEVGLFDPSLKFAMDLDVFLKLKRVGSFSFTREIVSAFRWHPDSLTVANRLKSSFESEAVKARYIPRAMRLFSFLWVYPVRWASSVAAQRVSSRS